MINRLPPALRALASALSDWWDAWLPLMMINFVASLCLIFILPGPPAIFGLYAVANRLAHGQLTDFSDFVDGARRYFLKSWLWALPSLILAFLAWNGLRFYALIGSEIGTALQSLVAVVVVGWIIIQVYALPYFMEQQDKRLLVAWRNGLFTALASPIYTLTVIIVAALIVAVSIASVALVFLGGMCLFALFGTYAVFNRLERFGIRQREAERHDESSEKMDK